VALAYWSMILSTPPYFFFFQAEDGIRDFHVTGVQTCALPISRAVDQRRAALGEGGRHHQVLRARDGRHVEDDHRSHEARGLRVRSEERRVGKSVDVGGGRGRET